MNRKLSSPVLLVSCKQEFLDDPGGRRHRGQLLQDPEDALAATIACYNTLQQEVTNQGSSGTSVGTSETSAPTTPTRADPATDDPL